MLELNLTEETSRCGGVQVPSLQIQYSQKVMLDFNGLSWPHVSVASLTPSAPIPIPDYLLPLI